MINSKLIQLFNSFSTDEVSRLRDFVQSPYHNKHKVLESLGVYLCDLHPYNNDKNTHREVVWQHLMPNEPYNDLKLRHLSSNLLKLCEAFLIAEGTRQNPLQQQVLLLAAYRKKKLNKHFDAIGRAAHRQTSGALAIEDHYHYYQLLLEEERMQEEFKERRSITGLQQVSDALDEAYMIAKLKQACGMVSYENIYKKPYRYTLLQPILDEVNHNPTLTTPLLRAYYHGFMTLRDPEAHEHFNALKTLLQNQSETIPFHEAQELHIIARNFCIRRFNLGDQQYFRELFELYRLGLEDGVLINEQGYLSPSAYKNIVAVAARLKKYNWAQRFVHDKTSLLEPRYRNDYQNYNLARLFFARKNLGKALQLLNQVEYHDVFVAADARTLLAKTYFELDEFDTLHALLDSFKQFVNRRKELAYHRENYLNTIKFIRYLLNLNPYDKKRRDKLEKKITETRVLTEKDWLLKQLQNTP